MIFAAIGTLCIDSSCLVEQSLTGSCPGSLSGDAQIDRRWTGAVIFLRLIMFRHSSRSRLLTLFGHLAGMCHLRVWLSNYLGQAAA